MKGKTYMDKVMITSIIMLIKIKTDNHGKKKKKKVEVKELSPIDKKRLLS